MRVAEKVNDVWRFLIYDIGGKCIAEYGGAASTDEGGVKYPLKDWQGSTRGSISNTGNVQSRQDFTAFGEEIGAGTGLRTSGQGFGASDTLREKYGLTERDDATGLDHTWFRKHENQAGRWTSPDPYNGSMSLGSSQSFNRYSYVGNEPTNFVDPSGLNADSGITYWSCYITWRSDADGGNFRITGISCQIWSGGGGSGGSPTPLTPNENNKLDKRINKINTKLDTKRCKEFLEGKKRNGQGISIADLKAQLANQSRRFSGPNSANITAAQAGITNNPVTGGWTVSEWFKKNGGLNGIVQAAVGSGGSVYYRNFNSVTTILHENLHVSSGLGDIALANRLGLTHNGTIESASQAISSALKSNGCT